MTNNKQQTAVKLYTEEQLLNTIDAIRDYLKNYPEKFHESMIKKHLTALTPIELPTDDEMQKSNPFVFQNPFHRGNFRDRDMNIWELGAKWMRDKIRGGEQ